MHPLAGGAVAVLGGQRLVPAQLVLDGAAVAFASPLDLKLLALVPYPVGGAELPLVFLAVGGRAGLVPVGLVAVAALVALGRLVHLV